MKGGGMPSRQFIRVNTRHTDQKKPYMPYAAPGSSNYMDLVVRPSDMCGLWVPHRGGCYSYDNEFTGCGGDSQRLTGM